MPFVFSHLLFKDQFQTQEGQETLVREKPDRQVHNWKSFTVEGREKAFPEGRGNWFHCQLHPPRGGWLWRLLTPPDKESEHSDDMSSNVNLLPEFANFFFPIRKNISSSYWMQMDRIFKIQTFEKSFNSLLFGALNWFANDSSHSVKEALKT